MMEIQQAIPGPASDVDHLPLQDPDQSSSPPKPHVSDTSVHTSSEPPPSRSPSPSPSPPSRPRGHTHSRHIQRTIDFQSFSLDSTNKQLYEEARAANNNMQSGDEVSTPTHSTPPSECGSQDSGWSSRGLKPPEQKKRRSSTNRRAAGERDDGLCTLPSPPPSLLRTTTFWRNTTRSALGDPKYSPATQLVRNSTWVAAGLETSEPVGDNSALCIESRTKTHKLVLPPETI